MVSSGYPSVHEYGLPASMHAFVLCRGSNNLGNAEARQSSRQC